MRYLLVISLFFIFEAHSQNISSNPFANYPLFEKFKTEDSIDGVFTDDNLLKVVADTLPIYTLEESESWRHIRLVKYYYDSLNVLKKVYYRNGQEGYYYFYFDGTDLTKARNITPTSDTFNFYFYKQDNELSISEIEQKIEDANQKKHFYKILKLAKEFMKKSKGFVFTPQHLTLSLAKCRLQNKCSAVYRHSASVSSVESRMSFGI